MPTNVRNIRIDEDLWQRAVARAKDEGMTASELVRWLLEDYLDGDRALLDAELRDGVTRLRALRAALRAL